MKKSLKIIISCAVCGKGIEWSSGQKWYRPKFCSRKCCGQWKSKHKSGIGSRGGGYTLFTCTACGKRFKMRKWVARKKAASGTGGLCSKKCVYIWTGKRISEIKGGKKFVIIKCKMCGKKFKTYPRRKGYCSVKCWGKSRRKPRIKIRCNVCRKLILRIRRPKRASYCSEKCFRNRSVNCWLPKRKIICRECGKEKFVGGGFYSYKIKKKSPFFCSQECAHQFQIHQRYPKPNNPESILLSILCKYNFRYTGNGVLRIGRKFPDYVHKSEKKVIELFGDYWHSESEVKPRIQLFKKHGFKCLVIWESDLMKHRNKVIEKIAQFAKAA